MPAKDRDSHHRDTEEIRNQKATADLTDEHGFLSGLGDDFAPCLCGVLDLRFGPEGRHSGVRLTVWFDWENGVLPGPRFATIFLTTEFTEKIGLPPRHRGTEEIRK